jgi:phenylpropionate dioxygenase-like ring-hydroxylating dioxygenase large terminal subunit/putative sterol carrier protein
MRRAAKLYTAAVRSMWHRRPQLSRSRHKPQRIRCLPEVAVPARFPFPSLPIGWFAVTFSADLVAGQARALRCFAQDLVLFRTEAGVAVLLDAYCPHLGAHLGHGGCVVGETIRCPFHAWRFDAHGACVEVPSATRIPPLAKARVWPVREHDGVVLAWHHPEGLEPTWELPELAWQGWTPPLTVEWQVATHPQEIAENTVDMAHLQPIHDATHARIVRELKPEGHLLDVAIAFTASGAPIGMPESWNDVRLDVTLHGLGLLHVLTHVVTSDLHARQAIFLTPIDAETTMVRAVTSTRVLPDPDFSDEMARTFYEAFVVDFPRDFPLWEHKIYRARPVLAHGEGGIGLYRRWAKQFYIRAEERVQAAELPELALESQDYLRPETLSAKVAHDVPQAKGWLAKVRDLVAGTPATVPSVRQIPSIEHYFDTLPTRFVAKAAHGLDAVIQWDITGPGGATWHAVLREGAMALQPGTHAQPTVTVSIDAADYLAMINKEVDGARLFASGRGKLRGNVRLAMRMQSLFPL